MTEQRKNPRSLSTNYQERRRIAALEQQQSARSKAIESRRRVHDLALFIEPQQEEHGNQATRESAQSSEEYSAHFPSSAKIKLPHEQTQAATTTAAAEKYRQQQKELRHYWASHLMNPEWLIEIPSNLAKEWYVLPRPEGQRCTVLASKGRTISRLRNGIFFEDFQSELPFGSKEMNQGGGGQPHHCLLDCIYHAANDTYYILDMMIWRGHELYDCTTEFRFFWMHSKLEEEKINLQQTPQLSTTPLDSSVTNIQQNRVSPQRRKQLIPLPAYPATSAGIHAAYLDPVTFTRDGLYFIHRQTHYSSGQTPLALTWKDALSSQYFIDTDAQGVVHSEQQVVLQYKDVPRRGVCTGDDPAVPLGTMPEQFVQKVEGKLKPGRLLKFTLGPGGVEFARSIPDDYLNNTGEQQQVQIPVGADLKFLGVANQRRGRADTLSKILFQMMARTQPITIDMLTAAAEESERQSGVEGPGAVGQSCSQGESIGLVSSRDDIDENIMND